MIAINLSTNYRVAVDYDVDAPLDTPARCYDTLLYEVDSCNNLDIHEGTSSVIEALEHVEKAVDGYAYTGPRAVSRALIKHLERNEYKAVYKSLPGKCPFDWIDCVIAVSNESGVDLNGAVEDWEHWYNGEYYTLALEKSHVWTDGEGNEMSTWDEIKTLYEVEFEDVENSAEVIEYARECFEIDKAA